MRKRGRGMVVVGRCGPYFCSACNKRLKFPNETNVTNLLQIKAASIVRQGGGLEQHGTLQHLAMRSVLDVQRAL